MKTPTYQEHTGNKKAYPVLDAATILSIRKQNNTEKPPKRQVSVYKLSSRTLKQPNLTDLKSCNQAKIPKPKKDRLNEAKGLIPTVRKRSRIMKHATYRRVQKVQPRKSDHHELPNQSLTFSPTHPQAQLNSIHNNNNHQPI